MPDTSSLEVLLGARGSVETWLEASTRNLGPFSGPTFDDERFLSIFSSAGRSLGKTLVGLTDTEAARLEAAGVGWRIDGFGLDELGRVVLLGRAFRELSPARAFGLLDAATCAETTVSGKPCCVPSLFSRSARASWRWPSKPAAPTCKRCFKPSLAKTLSPPTSFRI